mmetsp:Transcript_1404/g.5188  ORF Transcript_1404/g.5188 Transcript_1404/m.5188 type:complete len:424 (+) Transcript_1404:188-1459(+)|eukprot:CAMPEP_0170144556 /NCGR_PEP_ID=MMETSP0033_2-20121228/14380_1 /TAXON_ID=195969 /ORGANISM="Dolichomastix tenuilepis, Strain CCMP3274" /LENGTH=423 /DNA_ID=CAMNT_0010381065 /DNA_START=297 /DNA_END=1568 /DNA_ORIENTATION=+
MNNHCPSIKAEYLDSEGGIVSNNPIHSATAHNNLDDDCDDDNDDHIVIEETWHKMMFSNSIGGPASVFLHHLSGCSSLTVERCRTVGKLEIFWNCYVALKSILKTIIKFAALFIPQIEYILKLNDFPIIGDLENLLDFLFEIILSGGVSQPAWRVIASSIDEQLTRELRGVEDMGFFQRVFESSSRAVELKLVDQEGRVAFIFVKPRLSKWQSCSQVANAKIIDGESRKTLVLLKHATQRDENRDTVCCFKTRQPVFARAIIPSRLHNMGATHTLRMPYFSIDWLASSVNIVVDDEFSDKENTLWLYLPSPTTVVVRSMFRTVLTASGFSTAEEMNSTLSDAMELGEAKKTISRSSFTGKLRGVGRTADLERITAVQIKRLISFKLKFGSGHSFNENTTALERMSIAGLMMFWDFHDGRTYHD